MIFAEVDTIEFVLFGLELVEPNVFITDTLLGLLSIYFGIKLYRAGSADPFFKNWRYFFYAFGVGAIAGGAGHMLITYTGLAGKIPAWIMGIIAVHFIELAMLSAHQKESFTLYFRKISNIKLYVVLFSLSLILIFSNRVRTVEFSILLVIINTLVGVVMTTGVLGAAYRRSGLSDSFRHLVTGVIIMLPSSLVFILDINLHRWFDKNDLSHLILGIGIYFFYKGVRELDLTESITSSRVLRTEAVKVKNP